MTIAKTCGCCARWDSDHKKILKPGGLLLSLPVPSEFRHRYPLHLCANCDGATLRTVRA